MKRVAIVILNWNGAKMLAKYLPSVELYSRDEADIYIADNASTDNSLELLQRDFPECRVIKLDKNYGFAEGYNRALQDIDQEYLLLLNSDVEATHHWLTPLIEFMDQNADFAACQPKLLACQDRDSFEYAGASGGFIDRLGYPFCRGRVFGTVELDQGQYDNTAEIEWATGAAMMIRRDDFRAAGGFDPRFFAHNEEIDLCWRLRTAGRKIACVPDSYVYHLGGGTLPKGNPTKTYLNFRNNLAMLYKCLPDSELRKVMRARAILDIIAAMQALIIGRSPADCNAILRARRDFRRLKPTLAPTRAALQAARKPGAALPKYPISILWQYYIKGRKRFSDIAEE